MTTPSQNSIFEVNLISGNYFIDHDYVYYTSIVTLVIFTSQTATMKNEEEKKTHKKKTEFN